MKKLLLTLLGAILALPGIARDFTYTYEGQTLTYTVLDETAKTCQTKAGEGTTSGNPSTLSGELIIPSTANDGTNNYTVTAVGDLSFYKNSNLTAVTIPGSVTTIGNSAFYMCIKLDKITLNEGLVTISDRAFGSETHGGGQSGGSGAPHASGNLNMPSTVKYVGTGAFTSRQFMTVYITDLDAWMNVDFNGSDSYPLTNIPATQTKGLLLNNEPITSVTFPESVTEVKPYVFYKVRSITSVTLHDGIKSIGDGAFGYTKITSIVLPANLETIGDNAFRNSALESLDLPSNLRSIGYGAFASLGTNGLMSVTIPASVTTIGEYAFGLTARTNITLAPGSTPISVAPDAFSYTKELIWNRPFAEGTSLNDLYPLKSLTIGDNVTEIPANAFSNTALTTLKLGRGLKTIGGKAFRNASGSTITSISVNALLPPTTAEDAFATAVYSKATLTVPPMSLDAYKEATTWQKFSSIEASTEPQPEPAALCIALPNGNVKIPGAYKQETPLYILPDDGWKINTATLGDEDITADIDAEGLYTVPVLIDSKTLNVVFVQEGASGVESVGSDAAAPKVFVSGGEVRVEGAEPGAEVRVYDLGGRCLLTTREHTFAAPAGGVCILTVGGRTYKFAL